MREDKSDIALTRIIAGYKSLAKELERQKRFLLDAIQSDEIAYKQWYLEQLAELFDLRKDGDSIQ